MRRHGGIRPVDRYNQPDQSRLAHANRRWHRNTAARFHHEPNHWERQSGGRFSVADDRDHLGSEQYLRGPDEYLGGNGAGRYGSAAGSLGSGSILIPAGDTLTFDTTSTQTLTQAISNTGTLSLIAPGTLILSGANSFSASKTSVSGGGTIEFNSYPVLIYGQSVTVGANSTFAAGSGFFAGDPAPNDPNPISDYLLPLVVKSSAGAIALTSNTNENLNFGTSGVNPQSLSAASLGAIGTVIYSGAFTPYGTTYRFGGGGGTLNFASPIPASATVIDQQGSGTTIINASDAFAGTISITAGNLEFNNFTTTMHTNSITVGSGGAVAVGPAWIDQFVFLNPSNTTPITSSLLSLVKTSSQGALARCGYEREARFQQCRSLWRFSFAEPWCDRRGELWRNAGSIRHDVSRRWRRRNSNDQQCPSECRHGHLACGIGQRQRGIDEFGEQLYGRHDDFRRHAANRRGLGERQCPARRRSRDADKQYHNQRWHFAGHPKFHAE